MARLIFPISIGLPKEVTIVTLKVIEPNSIGLKLVLMLNISEKKTKEKTYLLQVHRNL